MFIGRNLDGTIYGAWSAPQHSDTDHPRMEEVPDDHPDYIAFITKPIPVPVNIIQQQITALHAKIGVLETKVDVLEKKP